MSWPRLLAFPVYLVWLSCLALSSVYCDSSGLPTAWRSGIATNYGGPADGDVSQMPLTSHDA